MVPLPDVTAPTPVDFLESWTLHEVLDEKANGCHHCHKGMFDLSKAQVAEAFFVTHLAETQWIKKKNKGAVTPTFFAGVKGGLEVAFRFLL